MPRAIEIRVDPITKGVIIDTNFPNREVLGAGWEPQLFRLGWDTPEEIWLAMQDAVPTLICPRVSLRDSYESDANVLIQAGDATDVIIESALRECAHIPPSWPLRLPEWVNAIRISGGAN